MSETTVYFFKDYSFSTSAFKNAVVDYERGGDISYKDGAYVGFICFIPTDQNNIDMYAYENFTDKGLNRLKRKMQLSEQKYISALNDTKIDAKFKLNKDPDPKNMSLYKFILNRNNPSGINLGNLKLPTFNKIEIFLRNRFCYFIILLCGLIPISIVAAYFTMVFVAIISAPLQSYIRKIEREEWDLIFHGCLIVAPCLIIMSLRERLVRESSISELNSCLLKDAENLLRDAQED